MTDWWAEASLLAILVREGKVRMAWSRRPARPLRAIRRGDSGLPTGNP